MSKIYSDKQIVKRTEKKKKSIGASLLKGDETSTKEKPEDLTNIINKYVNAKHDKMENKLYKYVTKNNNGRTSLIQTFFQDNGDKKNIIITSLKKNDVEDQAQEEYIKNKRTHNLIYNKELRNVLLKNYKSFQFPKVLTKPDSYLVRFESYSHINQKDVNLGLILQNMKKNYINNNPNKPKYMLTMNKMIEKNAARFSNKNITIQSILSAKKTVSQTFPGINTTNYK